MRFEIDHLTQFTYSGPVFIEPMVVRLRPRFDLDQTLLDFSMTVDPQPLGLTESNDLEGNCTVLLWFTDLQERLAIRTRSVVETREKNPFDFLISDTRATRLPVVYPEAQRTLLAPFLRREGSSPSVQGLVEEIRGRTQGQTIPFLTQLNEEIHRRVKPVLRKEGEPLSSEAVLSRGEAACRDLAVLFMECCRTVGIASRFVSGYREVGDDIPDTHLHAWAEVYLPGAGWRGFDPTLGLATCGHHVALASGADPVHAAPTAGTYRGSNITSQIDYTIEIKTL
jgi:transglutaminase-like putative cysteine protease